MSLWIEPLLKLLEAGDPVVMTTIVEAQGSAPREVGARMLVHSQGFEFTVGGGRLEYEVLAAAREHLASGAGASLHSFALGPSLGQCCGGTATLLFEPFSPADAAWVANMAAAAEGPEPVARRATLSADGRFARDYMAVADLDDDLRARSAQADLGEDSCDFIELLRDTRQPVWLFGAGHVGRAVARALAPLPFAVTWVDGRENAFAFDDLPRGVRTLQAAMPEYLVDEAPGGTMFLVMTHSHGIDEEVCEAVLRRGDFEYLGLIGSGTKRARIRSRLTAKGIDEQTLERMTCPIGLPDVAGKDPAVIAASVAVDLLKRAEAARAKAAATQGDRIDV